MANTKEQLLKYFQGLDTSTLEKLKKYSELLIIPDEDLLVNATMSQMVTKAHTLADSLFPEWTDRSKSDFGEFLVELFALYSEKDFWYINAFANEGILRKMRSYSNAFSKASSMGYQPTTCKGAAALFELKFSPGQDVTYERGDVVISVKGMKFTNDDNISVSAQSTGKSVTLKEGSQVSEDVIYNGYNILIRKKNIDIDSITISIDNIGYTRVANFGHSTQDSKHFMVLPEEDGSCAIYFGTNGFGTQPALGTSIRVEYRICNGSSGNVSVGFAEVTEDLPTRKIASATMLGVAKGGTYAESLTSIKEKAPLYFYTKRAAINESIAEDILNSFPFVYKSKITVVGRDIAYRIIPTSGYLEPTASEVQTLRDEFEPCLMLGYNGIYTTNNYKSLLIALNPSASKIIADAVISYGTNKESVESSIRQIMEDLTNPLIGAEYGGSFKKNDVDILMRSKIPGLQNIVFKVKVGTQETIINDITLGEAEIFRTINQNDLTVRINVV